MTTLTRLTALAVGLLLCGAPARAEVSVLQTWDGATLTVERAVTDKGSQFCRFSGVADDGSNANYVLARWENGGEMMTVRWPETKWVSIEKVAVTVDGVRFIAEARINDDKTILYFVPGPALRQAIYNGQTMTIWANDQHAPRFPLTGSATALMQMSQCVAAIGAGGKPPVYVAQTAPSGRREASLTKRGGNLTLDVTLNRTTTVRMELDSGASAVVIPKYLALRLAGEGTLTSADFVGWRSYVLADGKEHRLPEYRLRAITVAGVTVTNVLCAVEDDGASLLLGRSFLDKFSSWSVDNSRSVLILNN